MVVKFRTCDTSKMALFCGNSLLFKVVNNSEKKLDIKIYYRICLGYFFRFRFIIDLFLLLAFLNINGTTTLHTNVSLTTGIPQQCLSCRLDVLVNFGQMFALFWYFYRWLWILFVYCECYLMIYLCGKPKRGYIYGSSCKTVSNSANN